MFLLLLLLLPLLLPLLLLLLLLLPVPLLQEMRELAVRGVDGPGLHVLDIDPLAWKHVDGWAEEVEYRMAR